MTTSTNERIHFFIKIYLSHFILERVVFVVCERWVGDRDRLLYWPRFFLAHSSTSFSSWLGFLNHGSLRAQSPLSAAGSHFGILSPTPLNRPGHMVILLSNVHLLPLLFRLFTQVHLLIDGSVEGQYTTHAQVISCAIFPVFPLKYPHSCFSSRFCFLNFHLLFLFLCWQSYYWLL